MEINKITDFVKDKKNIWILVPILLVLVLLFVFVFSEKKVAVSDASDLTNQAFFDPVPKDESVSSDKLQAYEKDKLEGQRRKRIEEDSKVRGSDFYFEMVKDNERNNDKMQDRIQKMQTDPYTGVMSEYEGIVPESEKEQRTFSNRMKERLDHVSDEEELKQEMKEAKKDERLRLQMQRDEEFHRQLLANITANQYNASSINQKKENEVIPESEDVVLTETPTDSSAIFLLEDGKRRRRPQIVIPSRSNLIKACIHGDQTIVSGSSVRLRLLESLNTGGVRIPANTIFNGTAMIGSSRLNIVVENMKYGTYISPVSFVIYDIDAIEGLNLPNNLKAEAAKKMEQGLLNGVQLPISSIGTVTSEVTSAITATTQVAKQILNMSLSQVKVHLRANYSMYVQEETKDAKKKREAVEAELEELYIRMDQQKNDPEKTNPLQSLIEAL